MKFINKFEDNRLKLVDNDESIIYAIPTLSKPFLLDDNTHAGVELSFICNTNKNRTIKLVYCFLIQTSEEYIYCKENTFFKSDNIRSNIIESVLMSNLKTYFVNNTTFYYEGDDINLDIDPIFYINATSTESIEQLDYIRFKIKSNTLSAISNIIQSISRMSCDEADINYSIVSSFRSEDDGTVPNTESRLFIIDNIDSLIDAFPINKNRDSIISTYKVERNIGKVVQRNILSILIQLPNIIKCKKKYNQKEFINFCINNRTINKQEIDPDEKYNTDTYRYMSMSTSTISINKEEKIYNIVEAINCFNNRRVFLIGENVEEKIFNMILDLDWIVDKSK